MTEGTCLSRSQEQARTQRSPHLSLLYEGSFELFKKDLPIVIHRAQARLRPSLILFSFRSSVPSVFKTSSSVASVFYLRSALERHAKHEADAVLVGCGQFVVGEAAHILHVQNLEDVVHAGYDFHIGLLRVHDVTAVGEVHQQRGTLVLLEERVVLVAEVAPECLHADVFAPL